MSFRAPLCHSERNEESPLRGTQGEADERSENAGDAGEGTGLRQAPLTTSFRASLCHSEHPYVIPSAARNLPFVERKGAGGCTPYLTCSKFGVTFIPDFCRFESRGFCMYPNPLEEPTDEI